MLKISSMTINAATYIDDKLVVYYSASCPDNKTEAGTYRITKTVADRAAYDANKETCESEAAQFEQKVAEYAKSTISL